MRYILDMSEMGGFHYSGLVELEKLELNLDKYNHFIFTQFINHATSKNKVLDFGTGIGTLSNIWNKLERTSSITCL